MAIGPVADELTDHGGSTKGRTRNSGLGARHHTRHFARRQPPQAAHGSPFYAKVAPDDMDAIVAYLRTVPAKE
jgi:hypothetical protein